MTIEQSQERENSKGKEAHHCNHNALVQRIDGRKANLQQQISPPLTLHHP
jgi:hypothetical protein